jgi:hypothetical protein
VPTGTPSIVVGGFTHARMGELNVGIAVAPFIR